MSDSTLDDLQRSNADLQRENTELRRRLDERTTERDQALERETATTEVLQVINSSPGDLAPVFIALLEKAHRLCEASFGALMTYDGGRFQPVAVQGVPAPFRQFIQEGIPPTAGNPFGQMVEGASFSHIRDLSEVAATFPDDPLPRAAVDLGGIRTLLIVPLRKDSALLGVITAYRQEVRPFSEQQIALLQNFAAQAVIAIENARLITETRETLEQQTATAEVLQVINASPGDLAPVFDAILEKAMNLCGAAFGALMSYDGERVSAVATRGLPPQLVDVFRQPVAPRRDGDAPYARFLRGEPLLHIIDMAADDVLPSLASRPRALVEIGGARTGLEIPLRQEGAVLGSLWLYRQEVRPFSEKQIALLQNFTVQAVIAMENARLITETREALEQQTATAEILRAINSSPGDLAPVFDAILDKAMQLCGAAFGVLNTFDGAQFRSVAAQGVPAPYADYRAHNRHDYGPGTMPGLVLAGERLLHIPDLKETEPYRNGVPGRRALVDLGGARTSLVVALVTDKAILGFINIYRQEVRPFIDQQIALLQNFAAQAVIAMENARLITETREALDQQTATAEVLQVINSSPGNLTPVFDAMLEKAMRLCEATFGHLATYDGVRFHTRAIRGVPAPFAEFRRQNPQVYGPGTGVARLLEGERFVHFIDCADTDAYRSGDPNQRAVVDLGGARSMLVVPFLKDEAVVGFITIYRTEVRSFTDKQIALLQNFAAQAVISMENARLLGDLRERTSDLQQSLEYQTATSDVLKVISRSTFELQPVLDTLAETAGHLCNAGYSAIFRRDGDVYRVATVFAFMPEMKDAARSFQEYLKHHPLVADRGSMTGRAILERRAVQVADTASDPEYTINQATSIGNLRTQLGVPLLRRGEPIGAIVVGRHWVEAFTERQIELIQTFADQAVIAIENARLLTETQEALEQQTATGEILRVVSGSQSDVQPVFEAIVESASKLCEAELSAVAQYDGAQLDLVAVNSMVPEEAAAFHSLFPRAPLPSFVMGRAVIECRPVNVEDILSEPGYDARTRETLVGPWQYRSFLGVPILRDGEPIGVIGCGRREVKPFTAKQVELVRTFADQAVIAIENARLLGEIQQRQAELRTTFDNIGEGVVMFDGTLRLAAWNRNFQELLDLPDSVLAERPAFDDYIGYLALRGEFGETSPEAEIARLRARLGDHYSFERARPDGAVIGVRHNPMPDGGIVLIYSDITERKRSEAEIRAARDAAEAAYRDLKAAQANLIQAEKMASLGQLTAGIAHEIKNPLNFVNNFAGLSVELLDELKETTAPAVATLDYDKRAEVDETIELLTGNLEKIAEHGRRADGIVKSMLEHSRGGTGERRSVDLNGLIEEALNLAYHGARAQDQGFNITLERDFAPAIAPIELVPQDITRVCLNLFGNGFYAADKRQKEGSNSKFLPTLQVTTRDLGDAVEIRIRDNGTGIPVEIKEKLFQPFFTTKPTGEGTGLGLSISYDIVTQQHGGTIEVASQPGSFTEFTVRLPRV